MISRVLWVCLVVLALSAGQLAADEPSSEEGSAILPGDAEVRRITLDDAVQMGMRSNLPLLAGSYDPAMAMERYRTQTAIFDPLVSAGFEYAHNETPQASAFFGRRVIEQDQVQAHASLQRSLRTGGHVSLLYQSDRLDTNSLFTTINPSWTQTAVLEATHPLLRGAGDVVMSDIRLARNGVYIAREGQRARVEQMLLQVVAAYWNLVYTQEQVVARLKSEDVAGELLRDAKARLAAEVGTPLDVAEARAGFERRRGERIVAEGERGTAQDQLRLLVLPFGRARDVHVVFVAVEDVAQTRGMTPDAGQLERYVQLALANRAELRASKADLANRSIDVFVAADAVRPQVDLVGRVGTGGLAGGMGDSLGDLLTGEAVSGAIGVQFSMFIGQRAARAGLRLAEWARRQAVVHHREMENQVVAQVRGAIRAVLTASAREQSGREEVKSSEEDVEGERHLLDNGRSTPYRVLQKESDLTEARTRLARTSADRQIAEAGFWGAIGFLAETLGVGARAK